MTGEGKPRRPRKAPTGDPDVSRGEGGSPGKENTSTPIEIYARCLEITTDDLHSYGVTEIPHLTTAKGPALKLVYPNELGREIAARFVDVKNGRHSWRKGKEASVFGLPMLADPEAGELLLIVRDEHEAVACQHAGMRAIAVHTWTPELTSRLVGLRASVAALVDDLKPETLATWQGRLPGVDIRLVTFGRLRLPWSRSGLPRRRFVRGLPKALTAAPSLTALAAEAAHVKRESLWPSCREIAEDPNILDTFSQALEASGVTGVAVAGQLIYLQMSSRLLERPVSVAVRAVSSAGKSWLVQGTLAFFPASAFLSMTAMSDHALMYLTEPLAHRVLVLAEAEGMGSDAAKSVLRSLLSEGKIRYTTVVTAKDEAPHSVTIEIAGPTGLLVTHTKTTLDPELETRLIGITLPDTSEHTAAVMEALAIAAEGGSLAARDTETLRRWCDFQEWLALGDARVVVPYARTLQRLIPASAVRMRRDFGKLLTLIATHALLHQQSRERDGDGNILATLDDYTPIRRVFGEVLAQIMEASVPAEVREVVDAVKALQRKGDSVTDVSIGDLRRELRLGDAPTRRRVAVALDLDYLWDRRRNKQGAHMLIPGERMPTDSHVLPTTKRLRAEIERDRRSSGQ